MKSWTRTLNLDDAHTLLAMATPGRNAVEWTDACHAYLSGLSSARRRELVRLVRDHYLEVDEQGRIQNGVFLSVYSNSPASAQLGLVDLQWAMSHPISLVVVDQLIAPALEQNDLNVPLRVVHALVEENLETTSQESIRKTRTVLLGALERIGTLQTRGTGQHRSLQASRGAPHPIGFGYLLRRELIERGADSMMYSEAIESSIPARITQCPRAVAIRCIEWSCEIGLLRRADDRVALPTGELVDLRQEPPLPPEAGEPQPTA